MKKQDKEWFVRDGSIYVYQSEDEIKRNVMPVAVAFNVGDETAKYICDMHNRMVLLRNRVEFAYNRVRFA